jgi:hypothetical protein
VNTTSPVQAFDTSTNMAQTTQHSTPTVNTLSGDWLVSMWGDKSSSTTAWNPPPSVQTRNAEYGDKAGRITGLVGDSGAPVASGRNGGLTATTDQPSSKAIMWTISLAPGTGVPPAQRPDSAIGFVAAAGSHTNSKSPSVKVPSSAKAGTMLLLAASVNTGTAKVSAPSGWKLIKNVRAGSMRSLAWRKVATRRDPGSRVTVSIGDRVKSSLQLLAYSGVDTAAPVRAFKVTTGMKRTRRHTTPTVKTRPGDWLISLWSDKSSSTTAWSSPSGTKRRNTEYGVSSGRMTGLAADSGAPVLSRSNGGLTATTNKPSSKAVMWSIALAPRP